MIRTFNRRRGFTLIELAIVLAVAGLLFLGLWRLLAGGNQQLRDQGAASQQSQLINVVRGFLSSANGQNYMTNNSVAGGCGGNCGTVAANRNFPLPLPASNTSLANCIASYADANLQQFCNFLPAGFSSATANSYGQTFSIRVQRDTTAAGTAPNTFSFMIMTAGGDTIPDTSGGRIASLIGNDGGFIYGTNVCNAQTGAATNNSACGAFGAWAAAVTGNPPGYGFAAGVSGTVASRTYVSPEQSSQQPWLARQLIAGDATFMYNTMATDLFIGSASGAAPYSTINLAPSGVVAGGGTINLRGGTITGIGSSNISLTGSGGGNPSVLNIVQAGAGAANAAVNVGTGCGKISPADASCQWALQIVSGDATVAGLLQANAFYANTFIYGVVAPPSDIRLKINVRPIHHALEDIEKLKPVSYTLKATGMPSLGVIAQDVEKVYPDLVVERGDGYKGVIYDGLIGPLIGAVQELKKENDELRSEIREQARRTKKLEQQMQDSAGR